MKGALPEYNRTANITLTCAVNGHNVLVNGTLFNGTIDGVTPEKCIIHHELKTLYGYDPNLAANTVGAVLFFLILISQLCLGVLSREWWLFITWGITSALEMMAYIPRTIAHYHQRSLPLFQMQLVGSVLAPAFMAAGIYYLLGKQITLYGEKYSSLPPMIYTAIFTTADVVSLIVQGVGGGFAANSIGSPYGPAKGGWIIVGGIAFQVLVLCIFIVFWIVINQRILRDDPNNWDPRFAENRARPLFKFNLPAISAALLFLLIRSIYRLVELSTGWLGYIVETERFFLIVDGLMIFFGMLAVSLVYPGIAYGNVPVRGLNYRANQVTFSSDSSMVTSSTTNTDTFLHEKSKLEV